MSELFYKLVSNGILQMGIWETIYMTLLSTLVAYVLGLPLGVLLTVTDKNGVRPIGWLNSVLGVVVNVFRSIPFIILMVAMLPVAKLVVGTSLGNKAMIVMLVLAAAPYVARMVESSLKEVDRGVIEALIPEAKPALIVGAVISTVTILSYSAMAGTIGGGGLGQIAITYGYQHFCGDITWVCVVLVVIIVQIIQELGMYLARKTDRRNRQ